MNQMLLIVCRQIADVRRKSETALKSIEEEVEAAAQPWLAQADRSDPKYETAAKMLEKIKDFRATVALLNQQGEEINGLLYTIGDGKPHKNSGCYRK